MHGNNEFRMNEATMREIVQYYFDNKMFADGEAPTVKTVGYDGSMQGPGFTVSVEAKEKTPELSSARLAS